VLGPILYNLFIQPIYDLLSMTSYADDNYLLEHDKDIQSTIGKVKMKSEILTSWFRKSGLKINEKKTEFCIFHKQDVGKTEVVIDNTKVQSKKVMKILGINFDSKLNWQSQVNSAINKAKKSLHAIRILSKYLSRDKLITLSTAYFYQKLYYGSQVWLTRFLDGKHKLKLLQASSACLRICCRDYFRLFSHKELHILCNRSLPLQWSDYATSMTLFDILDLKLPDHLYNKCSAKLIAHDRTNQLYIRPTNLLRVGFNCLSNRTMVLMKEFKKYDFKLSRDNFRKLCKIKFLNPANYYMN